MTEFRPSQWLHTREQAWTLGAILGEDRVRDAIAKNLGLLDGELIERLVLRDTQSFWATGDRLRLFAAPLQIHQEEYGPLVQISLWEALCLTQSVPALESCQESGSILL